jgi:acyl-coenzyme A thioesterase PaaI-like protein
VTPLTLLRAVASGAGSLAPVHAALGTVLDAVEPGHAVARVPRLPPHRLRGPGIVPVLGDLVLSAAVTSSLAAGLRISTLTLHTAMLGPLPPPGEALVARSYLVAPAGTTAVSRAEVCAADGRPVAHLTARSAVLSSDGEGALFHDPPDPDPFSALETELRAASTLANSVGGVQGGVLAAVVGHRITAALPDGVACDHDVTFVRGIPADGAPMSVDVEVRHGGRRLFAADARLHDADGRVAVLASAAGWLDPRGESGDRAR